MDGGHELHTISDHFKFSLLLISDPFQDISL